MFLGRNSAPAKADDSLISTTLSIKVRDLPVSEPLDSVVISTVTQSKAKLHDELKRKGEEKRRLLAALVSGRKSHGSVSIEGLISPALSDTRDLTSKSGTPVRLSLKKERKRKEREERDDGNLERSKKGSVIKSSVLSATVVPATKRTEYKRQKMREREKTRREKVHAKKSEKRVDTEKRFDNMPKFGEVMDRPSDVIKEMGLKLAQKLSKGAALFAEGYNRIQKKV